MLKVVRKNASALLLLGLFLALVLETFSSIRAVGHFNLASSNEKEAAAPGNSTANNSYKTKIALVFKTKTIQDNDTCMQQRFLAFAQSTKDLSDTHDVILLHEPDEPIGPAALEIIQTTYSHVRVLPTSSRPDNRKCKLSFIYWIDRLQRLEHEGPTYSHYWVVEDDVFFTGKWDLFFKTIDNRVTAKADMVSDMRRPLRSKWPLAQECKVDGKDCFVEGHEDEIEHAFNNILRVSNRFAVHLLALLKRNALHGHDEANFPVACRRWRTQNNESLCHYAPLFDQNATFRGLNNMGGWSIWKGNKTSPAYSLRGLAALMESSVPVHDAARAEKVAHNRAMYYERNLDVPRNLIFHPVKCQADETIGDAALSFAAGF